MLASTNLFYKVLSSGNVEPVEAKTQTEVRRRSIKQTLPPTQSRGDLLITRYFARKNNARELEKYCDERLAELPASAGPR